MIYDLINGPVVDQTEITVSQTKPELLSCDNDERDDDLHFPYGHNKYATIHRASSIQQIISGIQKLQHLQTALLFSVVKHGTEHRINVNIATDAKDDSLTNDRTLTMASLYLFRLAC